MTMLMDVYERCDLFLELDEEDGRLLVAANEAGREEFERLVDEPMDWDPYRPEYFQLPDDWCTIVISFQELIEHCGNRLGEIAAPERTTQACDDVLRLASSLALRCRVNLFLDGEFVAVQATECQLQ